MMYRFWQWFKTPSRMGAGLVLSIGGIGGILFWGGFNTFMEYTNTLEFCTSCHEMGTVYEEYRHSVHYENTSGVRAICSDCHVPKPWGAKLIRKIKASNEIFHKLMGTIDTAEKFEAKRMELAGNVWRSMKQTDSRECRNCHAFDTMTTSTQRNDAGFWHPMAIDEGFTCIDCHKGIAHQLPDLEQAVQEATNQLIQRLEAGTGEAGRLFTVVKKQMRESPDVASSIVATIEPGIGIQVQERREDGWIRVVVAGYEVLNVSSQLFLDKSRGVVAADVSGRLDYTTNDVIVDPETRLSWRPARIRGWVKGEQLIAREEALWEYAKVVYENECTRCHAIFSPSRFKALTWVHTMRNMRRFTRLSREESALVSAYLQRHAMGLAEF
jgi:trimethylamine-N-oxide reductase cytochrome c-type subunit TorC